MCASPVEFQRHSWTMEGIVSDIGVYWLIGLALLALVPFLLDYFRMPYLSNPTALAAAAGLLLVVLYSYESPTAEWPAGSFAARAAGAIAETAPAPALVVAAHAAAPATATPAVAQDDGARRDTTLEDLRQAVRRIDAQLQQELSSHQKTRVALADAETALARRAAGPAADQSATGTVALRGRLDAGGVAARYSWEKLAENTLVAGQSGSYYRVRLLEPAGGKPHAFAPDSYVLAGRNQLVRAAYKVFADDVMMAVPPGVEAKLYARVAAPLGITARTYNISRRRSDLRRFSYLPLAGDTVRYAGVESGKTITGRFTALEMPLVRAASLRQVLGALPTLPPISLLESSTRLPVDPVADGFELILFVNWR